MESADNRESTSCALAGGGTETHGQRWDKRGEECTGQLEQLGTWNIETIYVGTYLWNRYEEKDATSIYGMVRTVTLWN